MKLYFVNNNKINIYSLPTKVEDAFLLNYVYEDIEESLTLLAVDGKWQIESNPDVSIFFGTQKQDKVILTDGLNLQIKFNDLNELLNLYVFDTPLKYFDFELGNITSFRIGKDSSSELIYDNVYTGVPHANFNKINGYWYIDNNKNPDNKIYINNINSNGAYLKMGDVIFINGLKIIWMDSFIRINNPNGKVRTTFQPYKEFGNYVNNFTPVNDNEKAIELFGDDDIFFHTPRIKLSYEEKEVHISKPPEKNITKEPPVFLTLGPTIIMGLTSSLTGVIAIFNVFTGKATILSSLVEIGICVGMILGSILFPIALSSYRKNQEKKKEKKRINRYKKYLEDKRKSISDILEQEHNYLYKISPSVNDIKNFIINRTSDIWSREIRDDDFLSIRLGIGDTPSTIKVDTESEEFTLEDDKLKTEAEEIAHKKYIQEKVPISISLTKNLVLPIIINENYPYTDSYINSILLQLITLHSGTDLKLIIITNEKNKYKWTRLKYLNHLSNSNLKEHYFVTNLEELKSVSYYLESIYKNRYLDTTNGSKNEENNENTTRIEYNKKEDFYKNYNTYYLIITDDFIMAKKSKIVDNIIKSDYNLGFSILMIEPNMKNVPSISNNFVEINNESCDVFNKNISDNNRQLFIPEGFNEYLEGYIKVLANIPVQTDDLKNSIPDSINFLEMMKVGKIEQLNILNRWVKNDPTTSLATPIGIGEDGKQFELDLHEKFHGPHGLIAGATGSGKSEFIITYILSMAINYSPYEVQFVLIDYKGGGLAGAFENKETGVKIPHVIGTITNLDTGEMNRSLVSIRSELKRRQRKFNEVRDKLNESTIDIYKYQKFYRDGKIDEPISHLFIVSDEFAELKSQQPEFMDELVSTARIGRSLGVHLILATQKPSGVVDDQIWSNAKFKVSLKVQTAEDSVEMLKRPDAANLKQTGRFYLQIGYDELFLLGQSAWAGARYVPTDTILKPIDDSIKIIDNTGNLIKEITDKVKENNSVDLGDQLTSLVKYIYDIGVREKYHTTDLWLPNIPNEIYLADTIKKYNYTTSPYLINPLIGEYDDPNNQSQNKLEIDLSNTGHLAILGMTGSGKENLLTTLIYNICMNHTSDEVNFYILDLGAEILKIFKDMPQVGDVVLSTEKDKVKNLFVMLIRELNKRKELFSNYGGDYNSYIKNSNNKLPLIIFVLNIYDVFVENFYDYDELLNQLIREAAKYGIVVIETAIQTNSIKSNILSSFPNKIMMQASDNFDYKLVLEARDGLIPKKTFGRGLYKMDDEVFEFQTDFIYLRDKINDVILATTDKFKDMKKAKSIPIIPLNYSYDNIIKYIDSIKNIPIGINIHTAEVSTYDFTINKVNKIIGNSISNNPEFIIQLAKTITTVPSTKVKIIDFSTIIQEGIDNVEIINDEFTKNISNIIQDNNTKYNVIYMIVGIGYIYDRVLDEGIEAFNSIINSLDKLNNLYFILIDNYASFRNIKKESWYNNLSKSSGIWIGTGVSDQDEIDSSIIMNCDASEEFDGVGYLIKNDDYEIIKTIGTNHEDGGIL